MLNILIMKAISYQMQADILSGPLYILHIYATRSDSITF